MIFIVETVPNINNAPITAVVPQYTGIGTSKNGKETIFLKDSSLYAIIYQKITSFLIKFKRLKFFLRISNCAYVLVC